MAQYDVDLREYLRILRKRKSIIILMTILVGICSLVFSKFRQPTPLYRATASIKIEQRTNMALLLSGGFWNQQESMATHAYSITSFPVLKMSAVMLGRMPADISDELTDENSKYLTVIDRLRAQVKADVNEGTNIIDITATARTPHESEIVANTVAKAYQKYSLESNNQRNSEIREFIENQLKTTLARLKDADKKLQEYKEKNGLISIDEKSKDLTSQLSSARSELDSVQSQKARIADQLKMIAEGGAAGVPEEPAKQLVFDQQVSPLTGLRTRLEGLLLQRQSLLAKYTEKHPSVVAVENQIKMITKDTKSDLNLMLHTLTDREDRLKKQIDQLDVEIQNLPAKTGDLARLQRDVDLQDQLYSELQKKYQESLIQESGKMENVTLVKPANAPARPFNIPASWMIIFTGLVLGLIIGVVFAFTVEMFDTSMGTIEDVEASLQVPVLGVIPHLDGEEKGRKSVPQSSSEGIRERDLIAHYDPRSLASEAFRSLRTNLQFIRLEKKSKSFLVTSAFVQEGKTINTVNLALSLAQTGEKVLLIDADLRRSLVHRIFGLNRTPGLTDYVLGNYTWKEVVNTISDVMLGDFEIEDILKSPGLDNLHIIASGTKPPNPTEILNSNRFRELIREAYGEYNYILVDSPPILPVADPSEVAPYMDGVIIVYMVGKIGRGVLNRAKSTLDNIEANVVGVILNNVKPEVGPDYFRYHTHYYDGANRPAGKKTPSMVETVFSEGLIKYVSEHRFGIILFFIALLLLILGMFMTF